MLVPGCASESEDGPIDIGVFHAPGKADEIVVVQVPFEVGAGEQVDYTFTTTGHLDVTTHQDRGRSWERLQLVARSGSYRRRSWRGRSPFLNIPADRVGRQPISYSLTVLSWGSAPAYGYIQVETQMPEPAGIRTVFNQPDCPDCEDPEGSLRNQLLKAIQSAEYTIDMAVYGFEDPALVEALCLATEAGITVRAVADDSSEDPEGSRSYWPWFFSPETGIAGCGAQVEAVRGSGIMHHKFLLIDRHTDSSQLVTGSANFTTLGMELNHNHLLFIRGVPGLFEAFGQEFDQLFGHCQVDRLDGRDTCFECTPACCENRSPEGPWEVPDGEVRAYFSPSDDPLAILRGQSEKITRETPDPACHGDQAECVCRRSKNYWSCQYCAQGEDGWGLIGQAQERVATSMYAATDQCFALGMVRAERRNVQTLGIWDYQMSKQPASQKDFLCAEGVPTYVCNWDDYSFLARNHNKLVVIDDVVIDGSMNLSERASVKNNEGMLVIHSSGLADTIADYIDTEVALLHERGVLPEVASECRCNDLVDNDGDGAADDQDPDCDGSL
jgi:phosphatidylserine/phosphatidylglycerophosphate/cardiolipin synthase-like enzyme